MRKHLLKDLQDNASCQVKVDGNLSTTVAKVGVPICFSFISGQLSCLLLVLIPMFVQGEMWIKGHVLRSILAPYARNGMERLLCGEGCEFL